MQFNVPAYRKQKLLLDFASLKYDSPPGVYMSLSPGDPSLWSGVLFVRKGPYAPAPLRFQISFPISPSEDDIPPLVTFSSDIFHPLVVPLTTYTFSTAVSFSPVRNGEQETVSATDEERLPPGGFSLRHGFPDWFGRKGRRQASGSSTGDPDAHTQPNMGTPISIKRILAYMKSTFDDELVLDDIPLEAAGNPGAWHAWKTYRKTHDPSEKSNEGPPPSSPSKTPGPKQPGEWNWEGVFEKRVRSGIDTSLSDQVLFGGKGTSNDSDVIQFSYLDEDAYKSIREQMATS